MGLKQLSVHWFLAWAEWLKTMTLDTGDSWSPRPSGKTTTTEVDRVALAAARAALLARVKEVRKTGHPPNLRVFGPCRQERCLYRSERCVWGFCGNCCMSYHRGQYKHEFDMDKAPALAARTSYVVTTPIATATNVAAAPDPGPDIRKLEATVEEFWPTGTEVWTYQKGVPELLRHPLFMSLTKGEREP